MNPEARVCLGVASGSVGDAFATVGDDMKSVDDCAFSAPVTVCRLGLTHRR
jgi:hypothetical protein